MGAYLLCPTKLSIPSPSKLQLASPIERVIVPRQEHTNKTQTGNNITTIYKHGNTAALYLRPNKRYDEPGRKIARTRRVEQYVHKEKAVIVY